jgi:alkylhydroperoxidase family enzyme
MKTTLFAAALMLLPGAALANERLSDVEYIRAHECAALSQAVFTPDQAEAAADFLKVQGRGRDAAVDSMAATKVRLAKSKLRRAEKSESATLAVAERAEKVCTGLPIVDVTVAKTPAGAS